jgi:predicted nucleotidyltransferase
MNFDVKSRTIYYVRHGSHAYGLNTASSDEDFKGICVKPKECYLGFMTNFEQYEHMASKSEGVDEVVYSLDKFARLAADCNPNIIEVLFVDDSDIIKIDEFGEALRSIRGEFLSKKAKYTFAGYASAQLHRIKSHRAWLLSPPKAPPTREEFGLSDGLRSTKSELGAFESMVKDGIELHSDLMSHFVKERQYHAALMHWNQYVNWKNTRNPARASLEEKFSYDTKHGMHLIRLMRMCKEILSTGNVNVKRADDREELLGIRHGIRSYESVIEESERLMSECDSLYETSTLPREPNRVKLDKVIIDLTERYLSSHG